MANRSRTSGNGQEPLLIDLAAAVERPLAVGAVVNVALASHGVVVIPRAL